MANENRVLKVLVACEESQTVCKAFRELGHEAYSNDIIECSGGHPEWHLQMDALEAVAIGGWDLMIAHPPCTHLAVSGARWFTEGKKPWSLQSKAAEFFMSLVNADIPHIAVENPVCVMSTKWRKPDQIIQPWQFGHEASKKTCLWLKGLPKLEPTSIVDKGEYVTFASGKSMPKWYAEAWGNGKKRSVTFEGIAKAMAEQWSKYILEQN